MRPTARVLSPVPPLQRVGARAESLAVRVTTRATSRTFGSLRDETAPRGGRVGAPTRPALRCSVAPQERRPGPRSRWWTRACRGRRRTQDVESDGCRPGARADPDWASLSCLRLCCGRRAGRDPQQERLPWRETTLSPCRGRRGTRGCRRPGPARNQPVGPWPGCAGEVIQTPTLATQGEGCRVSVIGKNSSGKRPDF